MKWLESPLELRATTSVLLGCLAAWMLVTLGVDSVLRALVSGLVAGLFSALGAGRLPAGWGLFSAGCALVLCSRLQPLWLGDGWLNGATWMLAAIVGWLISGWAVDQIYLWVDPSSAEPPVPAEGSRGLLGLGWMAVGTALWLLILFPSSAILAVPLSFLLAMRSVSRFRLAHPGWAACGALVGLLLAFLAPTQVLLSRPDLSLYQAYPKGMTPVYPYDLAFLPPPDPWLLGGLLLIGSVAGFWCARWRLESR